MNTKQFNCRYCGKEVYRRVFPSIRSKHHYCDNSCKSQWQRTQKPVRREWLVEHYIEKGMDTTQIGILVGRDPKSVWNWLKDLGIPTRPRGGKTLPHCWQKGYQGFKGKKHTEETKARLREIALADGRVPFDQKVGPPFRGKKGADTPNWKGGITPERQAVYSSPEWRSAVRAVYKRDESTCQKCRKIKGKYDPFDVHHIVSFECKELRTVVSNLILLCEPCHYWVHSGENKKGWMIIPCPSKTN